MTKLEQKRWVFEQYLTKMQMAQSDQEFSEALQALNKVVKIDPDKVADVFEASKDLWENRLKSTGSGRSCMPRRWTAPRDLWKTMSHLSLR